LVSNAKRQVLILKVSDLSSVFEKEIGASSPRPKVFNIKKYIYLIEKNLWRYL
jgi:hypothetical protein